MINIRQSLTIGMLTFTGLGLGSGAVMADQRNGGEGTVTDVIIDSDVVWDILESVTFTLVTTSDCIAVASSDFDNPSGGPIDQYEVVLALNSLTPAANDVSQRRIELHDAADSDDPAFDAIDSTRFWNNVAAQTNTVYWLGKKITPDATTSDLTVEDSTLTVSCQDGTEL